MTIDEYTSELGEPLRQAARATAALAPKAKALAPREWAEVIAPLVVQLYGETRYNEDVPEQRATIEAFKLLSNTLDALRAVESERSYVPPLSFSEAITLLFGQAAELPQPDITAEAPLEMTGWLEAHLDDTPVLLVTGVNEGSLPQSVRAAPLLPDGLRHELGLLDNRRRYARDAYWLCAIKHSRQKLALISGRYTAQNDSLAPSRLLFATDAATVARRALRHYGEHELQLARAPDLPHGASYALAAIPRPVPAPAPLQALNVTAFKDYLACPYRFYLKHICKLKTVDDEAEEMDGALFGNVAHRVLAGYGSWVVNECEGNPSDDAEFIVHRLQGYLTRESERVLGRSPLPVVALQLRQLERRLTALATIEAQAAREGWQIAHVETNLEHMLEMPGGPFRIYGRIDRIDYHPELGYHVLDYKTSDRGATPAQTHQLGGKAEGDWVDLQLPLYQLLASHLAAGQKIEVGYILLPQLVQDVRLALADWSPEQFASALTVAKAVIENVRAQRFWPPNGELARYDDGLGAICLDAYRERAAAIATSQAPAIYWPDLPEAATRQPWPQWEASP